MVNSSIETDKTFSNGCSGYFFMSIIVENFSIKRNRELQSLYFTHYFLYLKQPNLVEYFTSSILDPAFQGWDDAENLFRKFNNARF